MRVLEIVADGAPGGGTTHVLQVLRGLSGMYSLGLATQRDSYLFNEARSLGIECFGADFFRSHLDARVPVKLRQIVQKFGPHLVHIHGARAGFFYALAASRVPTVYTVHGYHFLHKRPPPVRWLALKAERAASRRADRLIFVSNHDAEVARAYNLLPDSKRSVVIHNGLPLVGIPQAKPSGTKHIGFIGRLEYQKDPLLFLDVLEHLPDYTATIVGGGSLEDEVRAGIKHRGLSRVHMMGALPQHAALKELSRLQVMVMTGRWEGLPHSPLEAMWSGVPVVATNVGGLGEIIESGSSGLLVDSRSPDDLARAVLRVSEDVALRERIIKNGRARVRSAFSEEQMLIKIRHVYQQVATLGGGSPRCQLP